ncbi:SUN domain-containing protein 1-like [Photinus pyralis]|uniref:SUN domain-containing protein 1-like n=1 Tax=Photinus pyralis TaxID=7054 RepID=UPI001266FF67|nr:SUN domain-containing protein 1-like [Photinus pyralis]XP_031349218.1 SUN domain-containing protein 1-like [Photinus pyralis]
MNFPPPCREGDEEANRRSCKCTNLFLLCGASVFILVYFYVRVTDVQTCLYEMRNHLLGGKGGALSAVGTRGARGGGGMLDDIQQALLQYDADKTTKPDFALESAGGRIISVGDTEQHESSSRSCTLFGIPICQSSNGPRQILQPGVLPGECWAFKGSTGYALIKLLGPVFIDSVSIEHISKAISPTGKIDTAPKEFAVIGLDSEEDDGDGANLLGEFVYDIEGLPLQTFETYSIDRSFEYIEFRVFSNHGNPIFTCVYRLRVHGTLEITNADDNEL